jgi:hypothetical protein
MNTSESIDFLSDVLLDDERIVTSGEREFLAALLRHSENNPQESSPEVTRAIARIAGEIVVRRAGAMVGDGILRKLGAQSRKTYEQPRRNNYSSYVLGPRPPQPVPPNPGPPPGGITARANRTMNMPGTPRPPHPVPPNPGPPPGHPSKSVPKGIVNPEGATGELLPPKCVVLEEFLAPAELDDLLAYTMANQGNFIVSEVISPDDRSTVDFEYRRSQVLMDLGPHQEVILNRLCMAMPRVLPKLGIEPFSISRMETQITSSKDGDFFRWHCDNGSDEVSARQVTFVYFFHREPKGFEGGELRIQSEPWSPHREGIANYYTVVPRQNQVVMFDSSLTHEITAVKCRSGKFSDSRFTVNGWFSR